MSSLPPANGPDQCAVARPPDDLWGKALGNLKVADQIAIRETSTSTNRLEILQDVLVLAQTSEKASQKKRWTFKNRKGEVVVVRDLIAKMVTWIEKFKTIGDTLVQYDPSHSALPWAAARLVLQAAINDVQTNGAMLDGLELVFNLVAKSEVFERLYLRKPSKMHASLDKSLVDLYTSILEFLLEAHRYFGDKTITKIAKSVFQLEELTTRYISRIKNNLNKVEGFVRLISGEILNETNDKVSEISDQMTRMVLKSNKLDIVDSSMSKLQDSMEKEIKVLMQIMKELDEPVNRLATQIRNIDDNLREAERLKIFNWLSTVEYRSHHRSKAKALLSGSGQWLLQKPEFVEWASSSTSSILWLHGIPGSGKSMLVAHVIEHLQSRSSAEGGLAYFYCARSADEPERADPVELLRSLLEQMSCLDESEPIQMPIVKAYTMKKKAGRGRKPEKLSLEDSVEVLLELLQTNPVTIVIDGLDECDPTRRQDLLDAIQTVIHDSDNIVKVFVSSRDDHDLVHRLSQTPNLYITASDNKEDIERFVTSRVDEAIKKERIICGKVPAGLRNTIVGTLIRKAVGMFRLASLHIDSLCDPGQVKTQANVLDTLDHLPLDLKRSYDTVLAQIYTSQHPNPDIADRVIKWLLCSRKPLIASVFIVAVCSDLTNQNLLQRSDILSICCNLVVFDSETDRFRFAHLSVLEYIEQMDSYSSARSNAMAAEQSLHWILTRDKVKEKYTYRAHPLPLTWTRPFGTTHEETSGPTSNQDSEKSAIFSFSAYADVYWAEHARLAGSFREKGRLRSLLEVFLAFDRISSSRDLTMLDQWLNRLNIRQLFFDQDLVTSMPPNALFVATTFNLTEIVAAQICESLSTLLATNSIGLNCAHVAARCDNPEMTRMILEESRRLMLPAEYMRSTLMAAAQEGRLESLKEILKLGGNGFVSAKDLQRFVTWVPGVISSRHEEVLTLFFENNRELQVDPLTLSSAFRNSLDGPYIIPTLVRFARVIEVTADLIMTAMSNNRAFGSQMLEVVLAFGSKVQVHPGALSCLKKYSNQDWPKFLLDHWRKFGCEPSVPWTRFGRSVLKRAYAAELDLHGPLLDILLEHEGDTFHLTWQHLLVLLKTERGQEYLLIILEEKPEMDVVAVNMILSHWDEKVVEALLEFQDVEITNKVIKIVAGNLEFGAKIMNLLLEKEAEMMAMLE